MSDPRTEVMAENLRAVHARIRHAADAARRDPAGITLVAVTKTFPAEDVRRLVSLGVVDVGENRDQEAAAKAAELAGLGVRWHFVGRLQRNKARSVAAYAALVHSVDRAELADALAAGARRAGKPALGVLIQVSLDGDTARGGVLPDDLLALADHVEATGQLTLGGVMAVAPLGADPDAAFAELAALSGRLRDKHPAATAISAGMSGDLDAAIRNGATHVRIGTALLGGRAPMVR